MKKREKGRRFKTWAIRQPPQPRVIEIEPEDLATYVSRAEKDVSPITLEETLRGLQEGPKAKGNDEACFQPFIPANGETPRGFGEVTGGIVNHPETNVWQMGMRANGPCTFPAAYRDLAKAQSTLETISSASRKGGDPYKNCSPF
jgi:hypothetical protein